MYKYIHPCIQTQVCSTAIGSLQDYLDLYQLKQICVLALGLGHKPGFTLAFSWQILQCMTVLCLTPDVTFPRKQQFSAPVRSMKISALCFVHNMLQESIVPIGT